MRNRTAWAATVTAVGVAVAMTLAGCTTDEPEVTGLNEAPAPASAEPSPTPTQDAEGAAEYSPEEQAAIEKAKAAVVKFYEVSDEAAGSPEKVDVDTFDDVAIDPVKTDRLGAIGYFAEEGQHQVGNNSVEISKVRTVKTASNPEDFIYPEVFFDICVDSSDIKFIDASGKTVPTDVPDRQPAIVGTYQEPGEGWLVQYLEYRSQGNACDA